MDRKAAADLAGEYEVNASKLLTAATTRVTVEVAEGMAGTFEDIVALAQINAALALSQRLAALDARLGQIAERLESR